MFGPKRMHVSFTTLMAQQLVKACAERHLGWRNAIWFSMTAIVSPIEAVKPGTKTTSNNEQLCWMEGVPPLRIVECRPTIRGKLTDFSGGEVHDIEGTCRLYMIENTMYVWRPHFLRLTVDGESELLVFEGGRINETLFFTTETKSLPGIMEGLMRARRNAQRTQIVRSED